MSDSSKSVRNYLKKAMKLGEKEPKEEVFSDDEPARKRSKNSTNSENSQGSSENSKLKRKIQKLEFEVENSNEIIRELKNEQSENSKKCENSKNMVEEMGLWMKKLEKLHDEDIDSLKKSINDSIGNLEKKFAEKAEEDRKKLKQDFDEKINNIEKIHQEKFDILSQRMDETKKVHNLSQENSKIQKDCQEKIDENSKSKNADLKKAEEKAEKDRRNLKQDFNKEIDNIKKLHQEEVSKLKKYYELKISKLQTAHEKKAEEFENFCKEVENSGIFYLPGVTLYRENPMIMSDNAEIPPTESELEFLFKCIFCKSEDHKSIDCRVFDDYTKRKSQLNAENRCIKCLDPEKPENSNHICSRAFVVCSNCSWSNKGFFNEADFHHAIICQYNDQSSYREERRQTENRDRINSGLQPRFT